MPRIVVNPSPPPVVTSSLAATLTARQRTFILLALSLGGFAIGTSEFASMGLMLDISRGLSITEAQVGHLISAYAIGRASCRERVYGTV